MAYVIIYINLKIPTQSTIVLASSNFFSKMSVKYDFSGKKVLITGGARGIGRAIVSKFIDSGAKVFALDTNEARLEELKKDFPSVEIIHADLLDWEASKKAVEAIGVINHLVNNAGITEVNYFENITEDTIDKVFGVNFKAIVNLGQVMANQMAEKGLKGGTIVNISSILDERPIRGTAMYCCTKAAVTMLTKAMASELGYLNIRVNCVRPTVIPTELLAPTSDLIKDIAAEVVRICLDRQIDKSLGTVEEVADAVLYLSSEGSSMVNGSDILVDKGFYTN